MKAINGARKQCLKKKGSIFEDESIVKITELEKVSANPWDIREYKKGYGALEGTYIGESIDEMLEILEEGLQGNYMGCVSDVTEESDITL
eukprot:6807011-Ditylum_brightwellii.AAC.1